MLFPTIFELGYELNLLPINSTDCAMGNSDEFQLELTSFILFLGFKFFLNFI